MLKFVCLVECFWLSVFGLSGVVGHDVEDDYVTFVDCCLSDFVVCLSEFVCDECFNVVCCGRLFLFGIYVVDVSLNVCWSHPPQV